MLSSQSMNVKRNPVIDNIADTVLNFIGRGCIKNFIFSMEQNPLNFHLSKTVSELSNNKKEYTAIRKMIRGCRKTLFFSEISI